MTDPDWDDDRLDAAFAARAERIPPAPPDLAGEIRGRLKGEPRQQGPRIGRMSLGLGLAAAVTVAIVVGVIQPDRQEPAVTPSPAPSATVTGPTNSPSPTPPVDALFGEPISVSAAVGIRDGTEANGRELVVEGFLSPRFPVRCAGDAAPQNPTFLRCADSLRWMMEQTEVIGVGDMPIGPAFHPSFALVKHPGLWLAQGTVAEPLPVVLVGHFHDRRAALCGDPDRAACGETFVVDQVAVIDGEPQPVDTQRSTDYWDEGSQSMAVGHPKDLVEDVDRLVRSIAPDAVVVSRRLVTIDQVIPLEPVFVDDGFVSSISNPSHLAWLVATVDPRDGVPVPRTFMLLDGSNWFAEITGAGAMVHDRRPVSDPSSDPQAPPPSGDPNAFDTAPTSVFGIPVRDIATLERDRQAAMDDLGRDEIALRAWYVAPDPDARCEPTPAIHRPMVPCDEARHWLLDRPEQYGVEPGQRRTNPAIPRWPPVLNPVLPMDVPLEVPASWIDGDPVPQPVIVLGHFSDMRSLNAYAGNVYFVLDALAWTTDGTAGSLETLTLLSDAASEDPASVFARLDEVSPNEAVANWATVVDAADLALLDPRIADEAPEFTSGPPVWIVRRLISSDMDDRDRLAIQWAYTADGGDRVWIAETPDSSVDLATTIDVGAFGEHTREVRVFDYGRIIVSVRRATAADDLQWQPSNPNRDGIVEVARGPTDRDIGIRWMGGACALDWEVRVRAFLQLADPQVWVAPTTSGDFCPDDPSRRVSRALLLTFYQPIDLDRLRSSDGTCCG